MVVTELFNAGDHVPVIPFKEVFGNTDKTPPAQIGATAVKVGMTLGVTVRVKVTVAAHCPAVGVKV